MQLRWFKTPTWHSDHEDVSAKLPNLEAQKPYTRKRRTNEWPIQIRSFSLTPPRLKTRGNNLATSNPCVYTMLQNCLWNVNIWWAMVFSFGFDSGTFRRSRWSISKKTCLSRGGWMEQVAAGGLIRSLSITFQSRSSSWYICSSTDISILPSLIPRLS